MQDFTDELDELALDLDFVIAQIQQSRESLTIEGVDEMAPDAVRQLNASLAYLIERAKSLLDKINEEVRRLSESLRAEVYREDIGGEGQKATESQKKLQELLALAGRAQALISQGRAHMAFCAAIWPSAKPAMQRVGRIMQALLAHLKRVSARLMRLIVGLLTPKEWKISGGLSLLPFGLASGNIEITFGPNPSPGT